MCDHESFRDLRDEVADLKTAYAVMGNQIASLVKSVDRLYHVICIFTLLMLLAVIWGAVGPTGFNAVTNAASGGSAQALRTPNESR